MSIKRAATSSVTKSGSAISDVPDAPTGLSATDSGDGTTASVSFTAAVTGGTPTSYTVTSSPGGFTGTGASSPISVTGLSSGTAYTFTATATNSTGTSGSSSASSSLTLASVGSYFLIQRTTVGSGGSATVTFSSITSTYKHLQLRVFAYGTQSSPDNTNMNISVNSGTSTAYSHRLSGTGSAISSYAGGAGYFQILLPTGTGLSTFGIGVVDFLDYTNTSKYKTIRGLGGYDINGAGRVVIPSAYFATTSAISSITISTDGGAISGWGQYSTFALYGIKGE